MEKMARRRVGRGLSEVEDDGRGGTWEINLRRENYGMNMDRAN